MDRIHSILDRLNLDASAIILLLVTLCAFIIPVLIILPPVPAKHSDALLQTHTKAGVQPKGNSSTKAKQQKNGQVTLQSLYIYPVKSCQGIEVMRSRVLPQGLEHDRLFTLAQLKSPFPVSLDSSTAARSEHRWDFVTQRQFPRLATVKVDLWLPDAMKMRRQGLEASREAFLVMRFPWREDGWRGMLPLVGKEKEILLPVDFPSAAEMEKKGYVYEDVRIWKETVTALNMSVELPRELSLYLGVSNKLALFRLDPGRLREVYRCAPTAREAGYQPVTGFQDAYPLHMITLDSVNEFSKEVLPELKHLDVRRFRANMILSGSPAYDEETWKKACFKPGSSGLRNDAVFHVSCRTVRCKMPNVDPETGERHPREPDHSLRTRRDVDPGAPKYGCLGMQLTPLFEKEEDADERYTWLAVGMTVNVEERGEHIYIPQ
ncbi:MOSC domain-containing protein [Poronia punctata]|nr:MOSC domain-containing protein [Poronia punctata]